MIKCRCPKCGHVHEARPCDPSADRERERRVEYEAGLLRFCCPGMSPLEADKKARERIELEDLTA